MSTTNNSIMSIYIPQVDGSTNLYEIYNEVEYLPDGSVDRTLVDTFSYQVSNQLHHAALAYSADGTYLPKEYDEDGNSNAILVELTGSYLYSAIMSRHYGLFMKIGNLILHGHHVELMFDGLTVNFEVPTADLVETCRLNQIQYLLVEKGYRKLTDSMLRSVAAYVQSGMDRDLLDYLKSGFQTEYIKASPQLVINRILNDAILELLQKVDDSRYADDSVYYATYLLNQFEHQPDLPNQDVTINMLPNINHKVKFGSFISSGARGGKAYNGEHWTSDTDGTYISAPAAKLEADIVNAWLYNHEEFRIPTRDELQAEYETLSQEYEDLKTAVRAGKKHRVHVHAFVDKFVRMQELSDILGTEPHGNIDNMEEGA